MSLFQSTSCAAFSWDDQDNFRGVLIERSGKKFSVKSSWQAKKTANQSPAQLLEHGFVSLNPKKETTVVVGGSFSKACFIDLKMPKIAASDLRNALYFELSKYTPIPLDEIQWGYRVVGKLEDTDQYLIRVVYFSQGDWESWISASSSIGDGVDVIIPAIAALDPVLSGVDVCLEDMNGHHSYLLKSLENDEREIRCIIDNDHSLPAFGYGEEPLKLDNLTLNSLLNMPHDVQKSYTTSVILGMYGVSDEYYQDRKQWLPVPLELRPKRHQIHKIYTMTLVVYLFFLSGIFISSMGYERYKEYNELNAEYRRIQDKVNKTQFSDEDVLFADALETEITELDESLFSMTEALIEVTTLTNDDLWSSNFNWDGSDIRIELRTESEDSDITDALQQSALLTDITMRKRQLKDAINYTINCRVKTTNEKKTEIPALEIPESDDSMEKSETEI